MAANGDKAPHDFVYGIYHAGIYGLLGFFFGAGLQALLHIANVLSTIEPAIAGLTTIFGVAIGFAEGSGVLTKP